MSCKFYLMIVINSLYIYTKRILLIYGIYHKIFYSKLLFKPTQGCSSLGSSHLN